MKERTLHDVARSTAARVDAFLRACSLLFAVLACAALLAGCAVRSDQVAAVGALVDADLPAGRLVVEEDTHGGLHGDGMALYEVSFTREQADELASQLAANDAWHELPAPDALSSALWGPRTDGGFVLAAPSDGEDFFPHVTQGYYYLRDRQVDDDAQATAATQEAIEDAFSRASLNLTIGLFDTRACKLYVYEIDT